MQVNSVLDLMSQKPAQQAGAKGSSDSSDFAGLMDLATSANETVTDELKQAAAAPVEEEIEEVEEVKAELSADEETKEEAVVEQTAVIPVPIIDTNEQQIQVTDETQGSDPAGEATAAISQETLQNPMEFKDANKAQPIFKNEIETVKAEQTAAKETPAVTPVQQEAVAEVDVNGGIEQTHPQEQIRVPEAPEQSFVQQVMQEVKDLTEQQRPEAAEEVIGEPKADAIETTDSQKETQGIRSSNNENIEIEDAEQKDESHEGGKQGQEAPNEKSTTMAPMTAKVSNDGRVDFKAASAQPISTEEFIQPEIKDSIMTQLVERVQSAATRERTEFFLQLKPEHLGGLSIMLAAEEKGVVAKLTTSNQAVQNTIQSDMEQLITMLRDKGINVVSMEVIYDQTANSTAKGNSGNGQQQFNGNGTAHGRAKESAESAVTLYDTLSYYEALAEQGGSVEFSA